jgi:hypothetical protein
MLQEDVRLVERAIAALNARDIEGYRACCTHRCRKLLIHGEYALQRVFPPSERVKLAPLFLQWESTRG